PRRFLVSPGLTPERVTRTRASPVPGSGAAISPTSRTSAAAPWRSYQAASTTNLLHRIYPRKREADVYEALHTRCIRWASPGPRAAPRSLPRLGVSDGFEQFPEAADTA